MDKFSKLRRRMMASQTPDQKIVRVIAEAAGRLFRIETSEIFHPSRGHALSALARQSVMYVLHVTLGWTQTRIAMALHRDRTTVLHGCRTVEDTRDEPEFDALIVQLEAVASACEDIEALHVGAAA